jgi:hypothetical protein
MTIVSTEPDGLAEPEGVPDGPVDGPLEPVGEGEADGAGVWSGGPESMEGAVVGGVVGTWPRPPELAQPAVASTATTRRDVTDRGRRANIVMGSGCDAMRWQSLCLLRRHRIAGT